MEEMTAEERALAVKRLAEQLAAEGRKDLLLRALGVPLLEELRIEAARGELSRLLITEDYRFVLADYHQEVVLQPVHKAVYMLFLNHPEGIEFKRLADYREEHDDSYYEALIAKLYKPMKPVTVTEVVTKDQPTFEVEAAKEPERMEDSSMDNLTMDNVQFDSPRESALGRLGQWLNAMMKTVTE